MSNKTNTAPPCLFVPPFVKANGHGRFCKPTPIHPPFPSFLSPFVDKQTNHTALHHLVPDSAEDFAINHFHKNYFSRKSETRAYKAGYEKARNSLPKSARKGYDEWNAALYSEVKKYVEYAPCARFRDPRRVPLFTQYAMWLNFVENYGGVRHAVRNR
jgi:hypothetical protein